MCSKTFAMSLFPDYAIRPPSKLIGKGHISESGPWIGYGQKSRQFATRLDDGNRLWSARRCGCVRSSLSLVHEVAQFLREVSVPTSRCLCRNLHSYRIEASVIAVGVAANKCLDLISLSHIPSFGQERLPNGRYRS